MSLARVCCVACLLVAIEIVALWTWQLPVVRSSSSSSGDDDDDELQRAVDAAFAPFAGLTFSEDELTSVWSQIEQVCVYRVSPSGLRARLVHHAGWGCAEFGVFVTSALWMHGAVRPGTLFAFNRLDEPRVLSLDAAAVRNGSVPLWSSTWDSGSAAMLERFPFASPSGARLLDFVVRKAQLLGLPSDDASLVDVLRHPMLFSPAPGRRHAHVKTLLFGMATVRDAIFDDIAVPDIYHASFARDHPGMLGLADDRPRRFAAKRPVLYWRGSTTGGTVTLHTMTAFPRVRAVRHARQFCDANNGTIGCDVHFTAVIQASPATEVAAVFADDPVLRPVGDRDVDPYPNRFLLDVDGNSFSARLVPFLVSRSVIVRLTSGVRQWFSRWLVPGQHFHPVALDASNLSQVLHSVAALSESEHEAMVARANELARTRLTLDAAQRFMRLALLRWSDHVQKR